MGFRAGQTGRQQVVKRIGACRFRLSAFLFLAACCLLSGCGGTPEPVPVWIGHLSPLSGPEEAVGESSQRGILLAVEEANKDPEHKGAGRPVRVRHTDTTGNPEAFGAEIPRLINVNVPRVVALIGGFNAREIKEFKRLDRNSVFLVSPTGRVNESAGDHVFFTGLSPAQQGEALARLAADQGWAQVVVLVNEDETSGRSRALAAVFQEKFPALLAKKHPGLKSAAAGPRRYGEDDSLPKRAQVIKKELAGAEKSGAFKPDAILVAGKVADVKKLRAELGSTRVPVLFGGAEGSLRELLEEQETSNGVYLATAFAVDGGTDAIKEFVQKFTKRFGKAPDVHAALAYDDARLLFEALRQARSPDSYLARKALADVKDFAGLTGPLSFDKDQQARRDVFIVRIDAGKATRIKRYKAE
jgi:branched-chain amino acid transport system substrate-binding protein